MKSFFNEKAIEGMLTGIYICPNCGGRMIFEDDDCSSLVCPNCGDDVDYEKYGFDNDEDYDALYPLVDEDEF